MAETKPMPGVATGPLLLEPSAPGGSHGLEGEMLRHFRIDRLLAEGGMGAVYLGFDTSLGRPVAIKTIRSELAGEGRFLHRFLREAQAQANVVHPHVLQAYFVGEERGVWFLAMQLVEGGSLEELLVRGERLSWKEAARHMTAVVEGMVEAARLGIVHRDIKPANLLLDRFGEVHVADFGLATSSNGSLADVAGGAIGNAKAQRGTITQGIMGTLEYMPPEQLSGEPLDERADIYALGVTFYQLLTGRLPYATTTAREAIRSFMGPPPQPIRRLVPEIPRAFADLVMRCLSPDIQRRPQTHRWLLEALRRVGPRPEIVPSPIVRVLALLIDILPFGLTLRFTYQSTPWAAFALLTIQMLAGLFWLQATPGQWLMRLQLRADNGGDLPLGRGALRAGLQLGFLLPLSFFVNQAYTDGQAALPLGIIAIGWGALSLIGSLWALTPGGQTLFDRLARSRVLVTT
jgi:serine/threonine protein kinase